MAEFSNLIITSKGQCLINKALANECNLIFTKAATSEQIYTLEQLQNLTNMLVKQSTYLSRVYTDNSKLHIDVAFNNESLSEGYYLHCIGLYANDPNEGEILFAVAKEMSESCYVPAYNGLTSSGISLKLILNNSNTNNVSVDAPPAAFATATEVDELRNKMQYIMAALGAVTELAQYIRSLSSRIDSLEEQSLQGG